MLRHFGQLGIWLVASQAVLAAAKPGDQRIYKSAYFLGRGDTGISTADEEDAVFYNPAGLAMGQGIYKKITLLSPQLEVSKSTRDMVRQLAVEEDDTVDTVLEQVGKPNHAGHQNFTGIILRRAALGVLSSGSLKAIAAKSPEQGGLETIEASAVQNLAGTFSLAEKFFGDALLLGVTAKYLVRGRGHLEVSAAQASQAKEELSDKSKFVSIGEGAGADIGMMLQSSGPMRAAFGLTVNDLGDTQIAPQEETDLNLDLKQTVNFGFSIEPGTQTSKFRLLADYRDALSAVQTNPRLKTHLGAELTVMNAVGITTGLNQGYPCFGVYLDLYFIRMDLGSYTEEISQHAGRRPDTRYFARIRVGL